MMQNEGKQQHGAGRAAKGKGNAQGDVHSQHRI